MPPDPPARLEADGVFLTPRGVHLVAKVFKDRFGPVYPDGRYQDLDDLTYVRQVLREATRPRRSAAGTSGQRVTILLPSSDAQVTVAEAAEIWECSPRSIR